MRLIDADAFKEELLKKGFYPVIVAKTLESMPTAYDVDKVVEQLVQYQREYRSGLGDFTDELVDRVLRNVIEIVRKGGVSDD